MDEVFAGQGSAYEDDEAMEAATRHGKSVAGKRAVSRVTYTASKSSSFFFFCLSFCGLLRSPASLSEMNRGEEKKKPFSQKSMKSRCYAEYEVPGYQTGASCGPTGQFYLPAEKSFTM